MGRITEFYGIRFDSGAYAEAVSVYVCGRDIKNQSLKTGVFEKADLRCEDFSSNT